MKGVAALIVVLAACATARAQPSLVSDISSHRIGINSSFTGTELLVFGALGAPGDVIVVVRGPNQQLTVRRKERFGGVWVNTESIDVTDVPGFYAVASNRPLNEIADGRVLRRNAIGVDNIRFRLDNPGGRNQPFADAIRRRRAASGLYRENPGGVSVLYDQLFRVNITFPANVPVGQYLAEVYLLKDGHIVGAQSSPIIIDKSGVERAVFAFAHDWPALYGVAAVIVAGVAGWGAAQVFRKR